MAVVFIIDLPSRDIRIRAIAFAHQAHDPLTFLPIAYVAEIIMTAGTKLANTPFRIHRQHIRHLIDQPTRRRCGGCPHDDLQTGRA